MADFPQYLYELNIFSPSSFAKFTGFWLKDKNDTCEH